MEGGVKGEEEEKLNSGLQFEVYNQGMLKTELCNKWEETGTVLSLRMLGEHCRLTEAAVGSGGLRASPTRTRASDGCERRRLERQFLVARTEGNGCMRRCEYH
jgi:hypothetical protein